MKKIILTIFSVLLMPTVHAADCPTTVKFADMCGPYQATYETLSSVYYSAMGEVGPAVAKEVMRSLCPFSFDFSGYNF